MSDLLQQAIDSLEIQGVFQRKLTAYIDSDFDQRFAASNRVTVQLMHIVRSTELLELEDGDDKKKLFRVIIALGVRWVPLEGDDEDPSGEDEAQDIARIECRMVAEYGVKHEVPEDALTEFAKRNASYHVWPYWRETVASQCARMNLPAVILPAVQFASNRNSSPVAVEESVDSK